MQSVIYQHKTTKQYATQLPIMEIGDYEEADVDIIVEENVQGYWVISDIIDDQLVEHKYDKLGHTKDDAINLFINTYL